MSGQRQTFTEISILLTRLMLGGYFTLAGVAKVRGELGEGLGTFYRGSFSSLQPAWLPDLLAAPYGYALPWLEVVVGVAFMAGFFGTIAAILTGLMIFSFTIALVVKFGLLAQPDAARHPFNSNYIQIAACALLACLGPGRLSVDHLLRSKRSKV
ncbi:MAG: DoxX family protein [Planctomycetota bacterium]